MIEKARQFKNLSIRGRVAYSICCLENALEHYGITGEGWKYLLRRMWTYTEWYVDLDTEVGRLFLQRWKHISKIQPKTFSTYVKTRSNDSHFECGMPNQEETEALFAAYRQTNSVINELTSAIFKMTVAERWKGTRKASFISLKPLQNIINLMRRNQIPLPNMEPFKKYAFYNSEWKTNMRAFGEPFNGTQYSKFLIRDKIDKYNFIAISIRGRVAYGICCLENALEYYGLKGKGWDFLLKKLWWYTELSAATDPSLNNCLPLERWWALISELLPRHNEKQGWDSDELKSKLYRDEDLPTSEDLSKLMESYKNTNKTVNFIVKKVFDIGSNDLWAGIDEVSEITLLPLQELIDIMYEQSILLPAIEPFKKYAFHKKGWDYDLHAFGESFDGMQYSKFVSADV